jgi:HSP20 family protein
MAITDRRERNELARRDQVPETQSLVPDLSQLLEGWGDLLNLADTFVPRADVEETNDAYIVEIELPGVDKDDIDISMSGRRLTVVGERREKERTGVLRRRTRAVGRFRYEVVLPGAIDESGVTAKLEDGVLTVRVPKAASERPLRIEVK